MAARPWGVGGEGGREAAVGARRRRYRRVPGRRAKAEAAAEEHHEAMGPQPSFDTNDWQRAKDN